VTGRNALALTADQAICEALWNEHADAISINLRQAMKKERLSCLSQINPVLNPVRISHPSYGAGMPGQSRISRRCLVKGTIYGQMMRNLLLF
jgi:hypothetical protein